MNLVGKSRDEIAEATRNKSRQELIELLHEHTAFEPMFRLDEIAARRRMSVRTLKALVKAGRLRAHKPLENQVRIPLSSIREWDAETALFFESIKH